MSTTATTNKKLQYPTTWQILYFAETFKHPCDRVCRANESPLVCKYTFDIELHNTLNKVRKLEHCSYCCKRDIHNERWHLCDAYDIRWCISNLDIVKVVYKIICI